MEPPTNKPPVPLDYARPIPAVPWDAFCRVALLISLFSCVFPLIAAAAITFAVLGLRRRRRTGHRGQVHAVLAILLSIAGLVVFSSMYFGVRASRSVAASIVCQSNLRQIGQAMAMYESTFPRATGYGWEELLTAGLIKPAVLECPVSNRLDKANPGPGRRVSGSYILLTHLEPLSRLKQLAKTVIAFEISDHVTYDDSSSLTGHCLNVLFADGHTESMPVVDAMRAIERSMSALAPQSLARPSSQHDDGSE